MYVYIRMYVCMHELISMSISIIKGVTVTCGGFECLSDALDRLNGLQSLQGSSAEAVVELV